MAATIENLTNPGAPPVEGDWIRITYPDGRTEKKQFHEPIAPAPVRRLMLTHEWLSRFTDDEIALIWDLAETNQRIRGWTKWLSYQMMIDLDAPRISGVITAGVTAGKLTQARADIILADP